MLPAMVPTEVTWIGGLLWDDVPWASSISWLIAVSHSANCVHQACAKRKLQTSECGASGTCRATAGTHTVVHAVELDNRRDAACKIDSERSAGLPLITRATGQSVHAVKQ